MARNYLPIQGSLTTAECAISSGSLTDTKQQNQLGTDLFKAPQLLKSAYHNSHISVGESVGRHIDALMVALDADLGYLAADETMYNYSTTFCCSML
jgi:hypothetical protein